MYRCSTTVKSLVAVAVSPQLQGCVASWNESDAIAKLLNNEMLEREDLNGIMSRMPRSAYKRRFLEKLSVKERSAVVQVGPKDAQATG